MTGPTTPRPALPARPDLQGPNKLFRVGLAALLLFVAYYAVSAKVRETQHLVYGLLMVVLALLPGLLWTKKPSGSIPTFAIMVLTTLTTYALPLLNGHLSLQRYSSDTITLASLAVILFQSVLIITHRSISFRPGAGPFYWDEILDQGSRPWLLGGMAIVSAWALTSVFTSWIPTGMTSILRAVFSGLGMICTFICLRDWGKGALQVPSRILISLLLLVQILTLFSSLLMVAGISLLCLALIGYVSGARKLPLVFIMVLLPVLGILHNGKSAMRDRYWDIHSPEYGANVHLSEMPSFYANWVTEGLRKHDELIDPTQEDLTAKLIDRSSLFHMLCLVIHYTPERQPFMGGETYADIPGQLVPRFLWPKKPMAHVSTSRLSIYYGLQREEDTVKTTIAFGLLAEAYSNFGFVGVVGLALFLGIVFKWIESRTQLSPLLSMGGLLLILFTAWSFQTEFPLSTWIASFTQACTVVLGLPWLYKKLLG